MGKRIQILLADGNAVVREALRALITTAPDMDVVGEAADSAGAVKYGLRLQPDIIILDLWTLGSDGLGIVTSLLNMLPQPRILVLTNEIDKRMIMGAIDAGVKGYLPKGTAASEILQAIRALYQDELVIDPAIKNALL